MEASRADGNSIQWNVNKHSSDRYMPYYMTPPTSVMTYNWSRIESFIDKAFSVEVMLTETTLKIRDVKP